MANTEWIYTVFKGRVYPGSAGQELTTITINTEILVFNPCPAEPGYTLHSEEAN